MLSANCFSNKRILIIHYRVGRTDGVSIEISAWKKILEQGGAKVALVSGPINLGANFVIKDLEYQLHPDILYLGNLIFGGPTKYKNEEQIKTDILRYSETIKKSFKAVIDTFQPTDIIVSNLFSHGGHLPAAIGLTKSLDEYQIPTVFVGHDFYWEGDRIKVKKMSPFIKNSLQKYNPPKRDYIKYCTINKLAQQSLKIKRGIDSTLLYDTIDFKAPLWKKKNNTRELLKNHGVKNNDLILLQATRIVERKRIELSIDFAAQLGTYFNNNETTLYDGRIFDPQKNKVCLLLAGYAEKRSEEYEKKLTDYAKKMKVALCHIGSFVKSYDVHKSQNTFSLIDIYPFADLITYPTTQEGFGNQFLEALFAMKPSLVFEYPVYQSDIKPKGFEAISLGDKYTINSSGFAKVSAKKTKEASRVAFETLVDKDRYQQLVENNFSLGSKHFSFDKALEVFNKLLF